MNIKYPACVLLASDERILDFLEPSVCRDWDDAVRMWHTQKQERAALQRPTMGSAPVYTCKPTTFSDEEFFSVTQQLEDITAVLASMTGLSVAHHEKKEEEEKVGNLKTSCAVAQDVLALDPSMYTDSLSPEQLLTCQIASEMFDHREYGAAAEKFSAVIDSCPPNILNEALLGNRAACYLCNENYKLCIRDSTRSYEMNDRYIVSIRRCVRAYICSGKCSMAREIVHRHKGKCGYEFSMELSAAALYESYSTLLDVNEHASALQSMNELLTVMPCASFEALKVQLLSIEEGNQAALEYVANCLLRYPDFPDLLYWRAQLCFLESAGKLELEGVLPLFGVSVPTEYVARFRQAGNRVQQCIDLCRDLDTLYFRKEWMQLTGLCTTALHRPFISERLRTLVLRHRARGYYETNRFYDCIDDVDAALRSDLSGSEKAEFLVLKASAEEKLSRWSDAVRSAGMAMHADRTAQTLGLWQRLSQRHKEHQQRKQQEQEQAQAQAQARQRYPSNAADAPQGNGFPGAEKREEQKQRQGQRQNNAAATDSRRTAHLYARLSLPEGADQNSVKKRYRALAMRWHPDKWCGASEKQQKEAEETFKLVKMAYDELMSIIPN